MKRFVKTVVMRLYNIVILLIACTASVYAKNGEVAEYYLPNGLKTFVKEDHRAPIVAVQVWYKVGSGYEQSGFTGISHALEHMMFRGTKKYGSGELNRIISNNGGVHDAGTSFDYTVYYETLPTDKLSIVFDLEADRMQGLLNDESMFEKEKQVVMEERKLKTDNDPNALTFERFYAAAFISNPYHNPIIGWMHDIQNLTCEDLMFWYKNWYVPNNAIIVVVGDIQPDEVFNLVQQYFGSLPSTNTPKLKYPKETDLFGERDVIVKIPAKIPYLIIGYNVPSLKTAEPKWEAYALDVTQRILSGASSARLYKELVKEKQIASNIDANYRLCSRLDNLFTVSGTPTQDYTIEELKIALLQQIEKLQTTLVSPEELKRIKTQVISQKIYAKDSIAYQATEIGRLETIGLSWKESEQYVQNINAVTPEQIQSIAQKYFISGRLTSAELQPIKFSHSNAQSSKTNIKDEL